ncbi:universal stress protein [Halosimplex aquaticum]|uniref:Universal stress protein n=1 Tax=Halosimplex aquaticum TaxID=3026162 RepID=A0ABD5Y2Q5_9EURY|nr:universal stress protein [Halosimplex aquaticum]
MGTIFVAYGAEGRESVLEFAVERATDGGHGLYVYHTKDIADEEAAAVRTEIESVLERVGAEVPVEITVETGKGESDQTNVSAQKRLTDAIVDADREFVYVVMGDVEHSAVESFVLPSMTEAVLETREVPVLLVPV